jgi:hypothetical protein
MSNRLLSALASMFFLAVAVTVAAQSGDAATAQGIATECDSRVKQGRMHYSNCRTTCTAMAQTLTRPMPAAQSSLFLKMCTDARANGDASEAQSNAESAALEKRQKEAGAAAAAAGKAPANPTKVQNAPRPKSAGGLLTEVGRETDYKFIDAVFLGNFQGIDPLSLRFTYMGYVTASDEYCGANTPNGAREIRFDRALVTKNRWGMEVSRFEYTEVLRVDRQLYDRVWSNLHTSPPGVNIFNAGAYDDVLSAAKTDYMRLFKTWKCAGPEIRQFQENLHRAAEGQLSLQAQRDRDLPLPLALQQSCDAYVQSPLADPSGYRLTSCACLAKHADKNWLPTDAATFSARFDATQVVLLAWSRKKPQLARECLTRETRKGATMSAAGKKAESEAPVSDDFGLLLRKPGYEFRALPGEPWCGLYTIKLELFHDRKHYDTAARVRSAATTFISGDLLPIFNAQCPKAKLAEMWVYGYGSAELLETWTFRWAPNGDWVRRTSAGVPTDLTHRSAVIHAPRKEQRDPYADSPVLRKIAGLEPVDPQAEACKEALREAETRNLGPDYCTLTAAQLQRASAELTQVQRSAMCRRVAGAHTVEHVKYRADKLCAVQRDGGPTDEEAWLLERLGNKTSCPPTSDPAARRAFEHIKQTMRKQEVIAKLAEADPIFATDPPYEIVRKSCAAGYLFETWPNK